MPLLVKANSWIGRNSLVKAHFSCKGQATILLLLVHSPFDLFDYFDSSIVHIICLTFICSFLNLLTRSVFIPYNMLVFNSWSHSSPGTIAVESCANIVSHSLHSLVHAFTQRGFCCRCHGLSTELNDVSFDKISPSSFDKLKIGSLDTSEFTLTKANNSITN